MLFLIKLYKIIGRKTFTFAAPYSDKLNPKLNSLEIKHNRGKQE